VGHIRTLPVNLAPISGLPSAAMRRDQCAMLNAIDLVVVVSLIIGVAIVCVAADHRHRSRRRD
jgi:hypothetical protein